MTRAESAFADSLVELFLDLVPAFIVEEMPISDLALEVCQKLGMRKTGAAKALARQVARRAKEEASKRGRYNKMVYLPFYDNEQEYAFVANEWHRYGPDSEGGE